MLEKASMSCLLLNRSVCWTFKKRICINDMIYPRGALHSCLLLVVDRLILLFKLIEALLVLLLLLLGHVLLTDKGVSPPLKATGGAGQHTILGLQLSVPPFEWVLVVGVNGRDGSGLILEWKVVERPLLVNHLVPVGAVGLAQFIRNTGRLVSCLVENGRRHWSVGLLVVAWVQRLFQHAVIAAYLVRGGQEMLRNRLCLHWVWRFVHADGNAHLGGVHRVRNVLLVGQLIGPGNDRYQFIVWIFGRHGSDHRLMRLLLLFLLKQIVPGIGIGPTH